MTSSQPGRFQERREEQRAGDNDITMDIGLSLCNKVSDKACEIL
jgi:hypothetical protein